MAEFQLIREPSKDIPLTLANSDPAGMYGYGRFIWVTDGNQHPVPPQSGFPDSVPNVVYKYDIPSQGFAERINLEYGAVRVGLLGLYVTIGTAHPTAIAITGGYIVIESRHLIKRFWSVFDLSGRFVTARYPSGSLNAPRNMAMTPDGTELIELDAFGSLFVIPSPTLDIEPRTFRINDTLPPLRSYSLLNLSGVFLRGPDFYATGGTTGDFNDAGRLPYGSLADGAIPQDTFQYISGGEGLPGGGHSPYIYGGLWYELDSTTQTILAFRPFPADAFDPANDSGPEPDPEVEVTPPESTTEVGEEVDPEVDLTKEPTEIVTITLTPDTPGIVDVMGPPVVCSGPAGEPGVCIAPPFIPIAVGDPPEDYTIVLTERPTGIVTIAITPDSPGVIIEAPDGTTSGPNGDPITVQFTPDNWDIPQTIGVTPVTPGIVIIGHVPTGGGYDGIVIPNAIVLVRPEGVLDDGVIIIQFTPDNWDIPQTISTISLTPGVVTICSAAVGGGYDDVEIDKIIITVLSRNKWVLTPAPGFTARQNKSVISSVSGQFTQRQNKSVVTTPQ